MTEDQLSFLPSRANARSGDPWTSHVAARSLEPNRLRATQAAVLDVFRRVGPMHHERLLLVYPHARRQGQPYQSPSGLRTRTRELVDGGLLQDSGRTVLLPSGRRAIVWEPAE